MSANNMLSNKGAILNAEIKNKGFVLLDKIFKQHGWYMSKNEMNYISYAKQGVETDFSASEYVEARFFDYIKKN